MDFFRGKHSWRKFWNLLDRLPSASAYREAFLNDPEVAEAMLGQDRGGSAKPALSEFTPEVSMITNAVDLLQKIVQLMQGLMSEGAPPQMRLMPRPEIGVDRLEQDLARRQLEDLFDEVRQSQERLSATRQ